MGTVAESPARLAIRKGEVEAPATVTEARGKPKAEPWAMGLARKAVAGAGVTVTGKPGVAEGSKGGRVTGKAVVAEATGGATGQSAVARTEAPGHGGSQCPRYQTKRKPIID